MRRRRAFTLIELLVVVSIIAVLISILLPSLQRAQRTAKMTACLSNVRQIAMAYGVYATGNRDASPVGYRQTDARNNHIFRHNHGSDARVDGFMMAGMLYTTGILPDGKVLYDPIYTDPSITSEVYSVQWPPRLSAQTVMRYSVRAAMPTYSSADPMLSPSWRHLGSSKWAPYDHQVGGRQYWIRQRDLNNKALVGDPVRSRTTNPHELTTSGSGGEGFFNMAYGDGSAKQIRNNTKTLSAAYLGTSTSPNLQSMFNETPSPPSGSPAADSVWQPSHADVVWFGFDFIYNR